MDHQDWRKVIIGKPKAKAVKKPNLPSKTHRNLEDDDPNMRLKTSFDSSDLQRLRATKGLNQKKLAMLLNCTEGDVKSWEAGKRVPPPNLLRKIRNLSVGSKPTSK
jgi:DNA-binding transcriptional regulator YiaG